MSTNTIPILSLLDYISSSLQKKEQFIHDLGSALQNFGFFGLVNHGLSEEQFTQAYTTSEELFSLEVATKLKYDSTKYKGQRGYTAFGREHAKDNASPDLKEFWHIGQDITQSEINHPYPQNLWPTEVPNMKQYIYPLYERLEDCALLLLEACSLYIGEPNMLFRDIATHGNSILRLIHYPPILNHDHKNCVRAAAHEDINLITLLPDATTSGLEIHSQGQWLPVVTPPGSIIVDSGDMLQNITNGVFKATTHRVVNPEKADESRYSMPFFVHARPEASLAPLESCIKKVGKQNYPNISAGDFLTQRLEEIGLS